MRVVCISDTHGHHRDVDIPEGDILIFAGDYTRHRSVNELPDFADWMTHLPFEYKVFVPGNHDWIFETEEKKARRIVRKHEIDKGQIQVLIGQTTVINGLVIHGNPNTPAFFDWAFNLPRMGQALREEWAAIPDDTDILITHGPPYRFVDTTYKNDHAGCELLGKRIKEIKPKIHVVGHIHECGETTESNDDTQIVNASICDYFYEPKNKPVVVEL